jgi:outer membrane lipoprotein SlyB
MRALLLAAILALALAGCDLDEPTIGGTILSVMEASLGEEAEESPKYYEPLVPEVAWRVEVQLDDGSAVTVTHEGERRYEPGERVRLLKDEDGELLL